MFKTLNPLPPLYGGTICHFERQNGEKRRGISISPEPLWNDLAGAILILGVQDK